MDEKRRSFLKKAGCAALGVGVGFPLLGAARHAIEEGLDDKTPTSQLGMIVDVRKCLANDRIAEVCSKACHEEHNVPSIPDDKDPSKPNAKEEVKWLWTEHYEHVFPDQAHSRTADSLKDKPVLVLCNHCESPSCVRVCPTGATWKRESDGIVMMDMHRCIGCRYCIAACPYGARSFNWRDPREKDANNKLKYFDGGKLASNYPARSKGVVEKCNFCAERLRFGQQPACVEALADIDGAEDALIFGDLSKPDSAISKKLREEHTICRRIGLGTGPNVFYIV